MDWKYWVTIIKDKFINSGSLLVVSNHWKRNIKLSKATFTSNVHVLNILLVIQVLKFLLSQGFISITVTVLTIYLFIIVLIVILTITLVCMMPVIRKAICVFIVPFPIIRIIIHLHIIRITVTMIFADVISRDIHSISLRIVMLHHLLCFNLHSLLFIGWTRVFIWAFGWWSHVISMLLLF